MEEQNKLKGNATPATLGKPRKKQLITKKEAQEKVIAFWATALVENGEDAIGCLSALRPNGGFTNKEILECAVKNKELKGYGNPIDRYLKYIEKENAILLQNLYN